jgi:hypothetical protein
MMRGAVKEAGDDDMDLQQGCFLRQTHWAAWYAQQQWPFLGSSSSC